MKNDNINHPPHYANFKVETIELIEHFKLGYHLGNIVKYISRAGVKDKKTKSEDLKKAKWYIERVLRNNRNTDSLYTGDYIFGYVAQWMLNEYFYDRNINESSRLIINVICLREVDELVGHLPDLE